MCHNPANARVDIEELLAYIIQLHGLEWNEILSANWDQCPTKNCFSFFLEFLFLIQITDINGGNTGCGNGDDTYDHCYTAAIFKYFEDNYDCALTHLKLETNTTKFPCRMNSHDQQEEGDILNELESNFRKKLLYPTCLIIILYN